MTFTGAELYKRDLGPLPYTRAAAKAFVQRVPTCAATETTEFPRTG